MMTKSFTAWARVLRVGGAAYWTGRSILKSFFFYFALLWSHIHTRDCHIMQLWYLQAVTWPLSGLCESKNILCTLFVFLTARK